MVFDISSMVMGLFVFACRYCLIIIVAFRLVYTAMIGLVVLQFVQVSSPSPTGFSVCPQVSQGITSSGMGLRPLFLSVARGSPIKRLMMAS